MKTKATIIVALMFTGCGGAPRVPDKLLDAESGKLGPAAAAQLSAGRQELEQSRAEAVRAGDAIVQARQEVQLAESEQKKTEVELERAKKAFEDAQVRKEAADARRAYATKLVDAREAAEEAAKSRVDLADAKLEDTKVEAIKQVNAPAGEQFQRSEFTDRVAKSQRKVDDAERKARELQQDATERQRRWEELARKAPAAEH
jgi:IgA-specific serine endopeptidase